MIRKSSEKIVIYGAGGHARSVADVLLTANPSTEILFLDQNAVSGERILGFEVKTSREDDCKRFIVAIGDNERRRSVFEGLEEDNATTVASPFATIGREAILGRGCFVGHHSHIGPEASIGNNTILNTAAIIEHESRIGAHCHVAPNAVVAGRCDIGALVFIGIGAKVLPGVSISSNVVIGAGSMVNKDIREPGVYVGIPVKKIKSL